MFVFGLQEIKFTLNRAGGNIDVMCKRVLSSAILPYVLCNSEP